MNTRVIVASKVQSDVMHVVDYMIGDNSPDEDKYISYLVPLKESVFENQYLMNSLDEGHLKNFHSELLDMSMGITKPN